ncbi:MAG: gliding motility protein RemB [Bacteroidetes bacterium]|jgi:hypothetical protein|nr:gliding motility protein RemB [Bacteroidota bacterium]
MYRIIFIISVFSFFISGIKSQNIPLNHSYLNYFSGDLHQIKNEFHTSIKPYNQRDLQGIIDSTFVDLFQSRENWIARKLFNEHFINVNSDDYQIIMNPLVNLRIGRDNNVDDLLYTNTRGIELKGRIGQKFSFQSDFYENQALFPRYIRDFVIQTKVIPGEGLSKNFNNNGVRDWGVATGLINFRPSKFFDFQFGHGKVFIGDGYRSLLLSDNAFNYPFLKITTSIWRLKYVNLFTKMADINDKAPSGTHIPKYVSSHYLSINIGKRLNIGLFETTIYEDSTGTRGYDVNYLNPIIFYRPIEFAVGSGAGNVLMGINLKYKFSNNGYLYGQFMLDEFKFSELKAGEGWWGNKFGFQVGGKVYNAIIPGLTIQSEINIVKPYTYSHSNIYQNYGHYNQSLAHPLGANFIESVTFLTYQKKRFIGEIEIMYATKGFDPRRENWGADIYESYEDREQDYGNEIGQGVNTEILILDAKVGYLFNPKTNLRFNIGMRYRDFNPEVEIDNILKHKTQYFYAGLTTSLTNRYHDF